jgi:ABC-2 type transport system permease protein
MRNLAFFKKELLQLLKTSRLIAVSAVFIFFGLLSPLTARYMNEIMASVGAGGLNIKFPDPTYMDAWLQFFKNISSICLIVFLLTMTGCVAGEKSKGSVLLVLTKQVSRSNFLLSKMASGVILFTAAYLISTGACFYYILVLFPQVTNSGLPLALLATWVEGLFFAVYAVFTSTLAKSPTSAAILGFAGYAVLSIPTAFAKLVKFTPAGLTAQSTNLVLDTAKTGDVYFSIAVALALTAAMAAGTILIFKKQEL